MYVITKTSNLMVNALANLFVRTAFSCPSLLSCHPGSAVADCKETFRGQLKQLFLNWQHSDINAAVPQIDIIVNNLLDAVILCNIFNV